MIDRTSTGSGITGGVDTHKETHTAAALDATGRAIGNATFPASASGYAAFPVVDPQGRTVGILSKTDFLKPASRKFLQHTS